VADIMLINCQPHHILRLYLIFLWKSTNITPDKHSLQQMINPQCTGLIACHPVAERWSLSSEPSLSCAQPTANGWPIISINRPRLVSQLGQLRISSFWGLYMSSKLQLDVCIKNQWWRHLVNTYEEEAGTVSSVSCMPERLSDISFFLLSL